MPVTSIFEVWYVKAIRWKFLKPILKRKPDWYEIDGYFCVPGAEHFLRGFIMDHKPSGTVISMFLQPLFANELSLKLSYSDYLPRGDREIDIKRKSSIVAEDFISKVSPYIGEIVQKDSLQYFVERIEKDTLYRNTRIAYDYGLALVLLERYEEAQKYLSEVANSEWEKRVVPEEAQSAQQLVDLMSQDHKSARDLVEEYMERNKRSVKEFKRK